MKLTELPTPETDEALLISKHISSPELIQLSWRLEQRLACAV